MFLILHISCLKCKNLSTFDDCDVIWPLNWVKCIWFRSPALCFTCIALFCFCCLIFNQSVRLSPVICFSHYILLEEFACVYSARSLFTQRRKGPSVGISSLLVKLLSAINRSSDFRYAGDVEINVEIKKYFCKAGVKGVQVWKQIMRHASRTIPSSFQLSVFRSCTGSCAWSWSLWSETYRWSEPSRCSSSAGLWVLQLPTPVFRSAVHVFCVFTIICFLETGHQLDWTDQPVRYSWTQVSFFGIHDAFQRISKIFIVGRFLLLALCLQACRRCT